MTAINERVIALRKYKGMNQKDFSELTGVARSTLSEVESGKNQPSTAFIVGLANHFKDINTE